MTALVERLREELTALPTTGEGPRPQVLAARSQAERVWAVSAERLAVRRAGLKGTVLHPVKTVLRRLMRWYVEPFAAEQREFNDAVLKLADGLSELHDRLAGRADALDAAAERLGAEADALARRALELEERLTRVERRGAATAPAQVPASAGSPPQQPSATALPDYFAFESRMRGSTDDIRERQRVYVDDFRDAAPVLDLGCGRGEFLQLLRQEGIEATGVDLDADMVAYARGEGLEVAHADAVSYLDGLDDASIGGIFAAQLVEHLPPATLVRLLELAAAKLRPGGILVAETINPLSPLAFRSYFADLTHAQPLVPETLELLARQCGFAHVETRFLNPPANVPDVDERIREILFAPLDYAIAAFR